MTRNLSGSRRVEPVMTRRLAAVVFLLAVLVQSCGRGPDNDRARRVRRSPSPAVEGLQSPAASPSGSPTASASPSRSSARVGTPARPGTAPTSPAPGNLAEARIKLTQVATLSRPLAMHAPTGEDALYIAEKGGRIRAIRGGQLDPNPVLDISSEISSGAEQGLLGLAISPDRQFLYVNFTDEAGDTRIREYRFRDGRADTGSARQVLFVDQPYANHNGGHLEFGRDGYMYIGLGDGGSSGDPNDNAQSLSTLLGKMLRIDPRPSGGQPYRIPPDNPFVGQSGARGEIWSYGLRNPWRYSFDRQNGDLYIGDVGERELEEIDFQPASSRGGENYGWDRLEGSRPRSGSAPASHVLPIYEYERSGGNCAVTAGYVYRGSRIPALSGAFLFGDYCAGQLRAFVQSRGRAADHRFLEVPVQSLSSFGQDQAGELYALSLSGPVFRIDPA